MKNMLIRTMFLNSLTQGGNKFTSEKLFLKGIKLLQKTEKKNSKSIIKLSIKNVNIVASTTKVKRRKITMLVPFFLKKSKRLSHSVKLISEGSGNAIKKKGHSYVLLDNILGSSQNKGLIKSKVNNDHTVIFTNKNMSHFRWF